MLTVTGRLTLTVLALIIGLVGVLVLQERAQLSSFLENDLRARPGPGRARHRRVRRRQDLHPRCDRFVGGVRRTRLGSGEHQEHGARGVRDR